MEAANFMQHPFYEVCVCVCVHACACVWVLCGCYENVHANCQIHAAPLLQVCVHACVCVCRARCQLHAGPLLLSEWGGGWMWG